MSVSTIGVIGAGVMGSGIAHVAATKRINVILLDVSEEAVKTRYRPVVSKDKMTAVEKEASVRRIKGTTAYDGLKPAGDHRGCKRRQGRESGWQSPASASRAPRCAIRKGDGLALRRAGHHRG
jgi:flavin-dependent dehydrogenase